MKIEDLDVYRLINEELDDPNYIKLKHGTIYCYMKGCKGPLCRKCGREAAAKRKKKSRMIDTRSHAGIIDDYLEYRKKKHLFERFGITDNTYSVEDTNEGDTDEGDYELMDA